MLAWWRRSWRADSRPRPILAPVMRIVWPLRLRSLGRGVTGSWYLNLNAMAASFYERVGNRFRDCKTGIMSLVQ